MHLVYAIDHLGSGGAQRQVAELAARLQTRPGLRVSVLVYHPQDFFASRLREASVEIVRIPRRGRLDPLFPLRIARWYRSQRPDVVHTFLSFPGFWYGLARALLPASRRPRWIAAERDGRIAAGRAHRALQRFVFRNADAVTANARPMLRELSQRLGVPAERLHYLPNGIDLPGWDAAGRKACPLELDPACFHAALIGRLQPQKNHALLLDALALLSAGERDGLRVWLVGATGSGGTIQEALGPEVAKRGLEEVVRFSPPLHEISALMQRLDVLLLPSRWEGFPNVLLEAMASGLPAIAAPVGDVPSLLVPGQTGFEIDPDDAPGLARALERMRALPEAERRRMGARAREHVEQRFGIERVASDHLTLYRRVTARG